MVSTINRESWNACCLIFVVPDKSENALYKVSAYLLSAREEPLLCGIGRFDDHLDLLSSTCLKCCKSEFCCSAAITDTNRQENGRIMVPPRWTKLLRSHLYLSKNRFTTDQGEKIWES